MNSVDFLILVAAFLLLFFFFSQLFFAWRRNEKLFDCITRDFRLAINSVLKPRQAQSQAKSGLGESSILATIKWTRLAAFAAQVGRKTLDQEEKL